MKNLLLPMLVLVTLTVNAQNFYDEISFSDFESWAKSKSIPGYTFYSADKEGEAEYNEKVKYSAAFIKGQTNRLSIYLEAESSFTSYSSTSKQKKGGEVFEVNGYKMAYVPLDASYSSAFLAVKLPGKHACLVLHMLPLQTKEEAVKLFKAINVSTLEK
jgi:hypothetical protein